MRRLFSASAALLAAVLLFSGCQSTVSSPESQSAGILGSSTTITQPTTAATTAPTRPPFPVEQLVSPVAILHEVETGETLFEREADRLVAPASITKLMTAITAFLYCREEEEMTVGADMLEPVMYDASRAGLEEGMRLTVRMLIEGLLLSSGCDAGYVLGVGVGRKLAGDPALPARKAAALFSAHMTDLAHSFGAVDTTFLNPDGYDADGHLTTARDLVLICRQALLDPRIAEIVAQHAVTRKLLSGETRTFQNSNYLLVSDQSGMVTGLKTGFHDRAGHCLAFSYEYEGRCYIGLVMGCPNPRQRWLDAESLIFWHTGRFTNEELLISTTGTAETPTNTTTAHD